MTEIQPIEPEDRPCGSEIQTLRKRVRRTQRRIRNTRVVKLSLRCATALAVWLIVLFLCDWAFQPSWTLRLGILVTSIAGAAFWLLRRLAAIQVHLLEAAEQIEETHPELREAVINAIQLDDALHDGLDVGSAQLTTAFLHQVEEHASLVKPSVAISYRILRKPAIRSLVLLLAVLVVLGISPATTRVFLHRVFALQTPGTFIVNVQPGDVDCVEGHPVTFIGEAGGVIPSSGQVRLTYGDQNVEIVPLFQDGAVFTSMPVVLQDSAEYHLELGRDVSRHYSIRLIRYPQMEVTLTATPPTYTGLEPQTIADAQARFLAGSTLQIIVNGSKDLREVSLSTAEGALELSRIESRRFELTLPLDRDVTGVLKAIDMDGLSVSEALRLESVPDSPPVVVLNQGHPDMAVLPSKPVEIAYDLRDDLGLKKLEIHGLTGDGEVVLATLDGLEQSSDSGVVPLALEQWLQSPGEQMDVYAVATDNSPAAQTGRSELVTIRVLSPREAVEVMAAEREQMAQRLIAAERMARQVRDLTAEERWEEALDVQQRCSSELAELQDQADQGWAAQRHLATDMSISFEQQRFTEQLDAAHDSSWEVAQALRESLGGQESSSLDPASQPAAERIRDSQQQLERELRIARALADPQAVSQALRDQVRDLVQHGRDRQPLADGADTQAAGDRADFWNRRQQQAERLQQDVQQAKEQGIPAAAPWIYDLDESLQAAELPATMAETKQALERMDIAQAQDLEQQLDRKLDGLEELLESDQFPNERIPAESRESALGNLIERQRRLLDRLRDDGETAEAPRPELIPAQEAITDGIRAWLGGPESDNVAAAEFVDQAEGFSVDAEQQLVAGDPNRDVRQSQQRVLDALRQADSAGQVSAEERLQQAQAMEQLLADAEQLRERQNQLHHQDENDQQPSQEQQADAEAEQQQIADAARDLAEQAAPLDAGAAADLQQAAQAAAEDQQAAAGNQLDAAAKKLAAGLEDSLEQCQEAAADQEQLAQQMRQEINELQQQQERAAESGSTEEQSQITAGCEQLAKQCEQAGAEQMAQELRQAAEASRQAEQSPAQDDPQQGGEQAGQPGDQSGSPQGGEQSGQPGEQSGSPQGGEQAGQPGEQSGSPQGGQPSGQPGGQSGSSQGGEQAGQPGEQSGSPQGGEQAGQPGGQSGSPQGGQPSGQPGGQSGSSQGGQPSGQPGGQSGSQPSAGQAGSPQQQASQALSSAEQAAKQLESQAAGTKSAAVAAGNQHRQQQQLGQMADQQQAASQPGGPAPTPADAARQQSLARQARSMARQVDNADVAEQLQQAANAADAAAQAIERNDPQVARDSQSLSAQHLRDARQSLSRLHEPGADQGENRSDGPATANTLLIDVPPAMRQQVKALFDSQKPNAYAEQLLEYSTKLRIDASSQGTSP